jgi:hypothetical protein
MGILSGECSMIAPSKEQFGPDYKQAKHPEANEMIKKYKLL